MLRPTTDRTRTRARHRWARGAFLRLEVLVLVVIAICLVVLSSSSTPARADLELTSGPGDSLTLSNDKEGAAILSLDGMRPGDSVTDTVTLGNTGSLDGDLSLSTSNLVDTPGGGGGALSGELDLVIRDVTNVGSPLTVYSGKIDALTPVALGNLAARDSRVYEFRVSFPDAGMGAENAFQDSAMSVEFDWSAVNDTLDLDPPETTITSGPTGLSASPDASFAFTSDESGGTFECSLDGAGFTSCTSPASYTGLRDGAHTFDVRATDGPGNTDATPDSAAWTIDATAPSKPGSFSGSNSGGRLVLRWTAATDNSGLVTAYRVYTNGRLAKTLGGSVRSVDMGTYTTKDARSFQVAARDAAGNLSAKSSPLVIIPAIRKLTLSNAKSRLTGRGLKAGTISYAFSSSIPSGRVIGAGRSGVVRKGTAVSLKVSRGALSRASSYAFPSGSGPDGTTSPTYTFGGSPASGSPVVGSQTGSDPAAGAPTPTGSETAAVGEVQPQSYTAADDTTSPLRRLLGLLLLGGAFVTAGAVALRARRLPRAPQSGETVEPLLFWDDRLVHAVTTSVRRLTGRF